MMRENSMILGAGMTGLSAGIATGIPVYEARERPGGICSSYYRKPGETRWYDGPPFEGTAYRFEYGGGHWIFGGDPEVLEFIERFTPLKRYARSSAVYLPEENAYVPYPLQYHLSYVKEDLREKVLSELKARKNGAIQTMADWVRHQFGPTLNELFFQPFHEMYTAGLWTRIRPQDNYKTPLDAAMVRRGAYTKTPQAGYNTEFVYPKEGLDTLSLRMAAECNVEFGKRVTAIDLSENMVQFEDGVRIPYGQIYSTLPLIHMVNMAGLELESPADPYTSVLVLNVGALRGERCPDQHWVYVPHSESGFHRIGFYSNVDSHFLPAGLRDRVSIYVERAFLPAEKPSEGEISAYKRNVERELQEWGMIDRVEVNDATWVDVAYTWSWPGSKWIEEALGRLEEHGIRMLGRYGRWHFQGIAASIREGMDLVN